MQCDECSYYKGRCTNLEIPDNAEELAQIGECPQFQGKLDIDNTYVLLLKHEK
jgi:hypothetical protein